MNDTPLTALATCTAIAGPTASTWRRAMAAGIPHARSRRPREIAFAVLLTALAGSGLLTLG